jgi:hypothetical protein
MQRVVGLALSPRVFVPAPESLPQQALRNRTLDGRTVGRPDGPLPARRRRRAPAMPSRCECGFPGRHLGAIRRSRSAPRPRTSLRVHARPLCRPLADGPPDRSPRRSCSAIDCDRSKVLVGPSDTIGGQRCRAELRRRATPRRLPCSRRPTVRADRRLASTARPAVRPSDRQTVAYASTGGHVHTRLRSPKAASIRLTGGHTLCSRVAAVGKPARSRA